jgi:hypothetical protein
MSGWPRALMGKVYVGTIPAPMEWRVHIEDDGRRRQLPLCLDVVNHSPTGFAWGYAGSGPAQLALAILHDAIGRDRAIELHQRFKLLCIAKLDQHAGWRMPVAMVLASVVMIQTGHE